MAAPLVVGLLGVLVRGAGTLVGRVLISLGIGYASYSGINTLVDTAKADLLQRIGAQDSLVVQLAGVLQVGTCVNILASAALMKLTLKGLQNGKITRMITKG